MLMLFLAERYSKTVQISSLVKHICQWGERNNKHNIFRNNKFYERKKAGSWGRASRAGTLGWVVSVGFPTVTCKLRCE